MSRLLFLARHGETEWNRAGRWQGKTDIPLSDEGRVQARVLAAGLVGRGIVEVHTSDLRRATETAEIVAGMLGIAGALKIDGRLRERGFGCFEGLSREECAERFPDAWARYTADRRATPPGGEPQGEVAARIVAAMTEIARAARAVGAARADGEEGEEGATLVVSHGGTIRTFLREVTGDAGAAVENGAVVVARWAGERFVGVRRV